jgi:type II secretory pathway component PulL
MQMRAWFPKKAVLEVCCSKWVAAYYQRKKLHIFSYFPKQQRLVHVVYTPLSGLCDLQSEQQGGNVSSF